MEQQNKKSIILTKAAGGWKKTKIGEFLFERKGKYKPDDEAIAGLMRINKIDFSGNFHIVQKNSNTDMIMVCPGDLVISGINVAKGAMGIYYGDENVTATIHYSSYTFDTGKIDVQYFKRFLKSTEFIKLLNEQVKGGIKTEIKSKHLLSLEIKLPDIEEQKQKIKHFESVESEDTELKQEIIHQQTLLKKLRQQILQEAIEGKLTADWRIKNSSPAKGRCPKGAEGSGPEGLNPHQGRSPSGAMVKSKRTFTLPHLTTFRKSLRKNMTPAEAKLWTLLKGKQLQGRKFRRQHSVANYVLDFYCPAEKLAIELNDEGHNNPQVAEHDEERGIFLEHTGIKVLRFENKAVFESPEGVLAMIEQAFNSSGPDPSAPSGHLPLAGEEFGSAGELLERIRVEKERLIAMGKMKRQKPLPPIKDEEKLFELPEGWEWCRLGEVTYGFQYGTSRKSVKNSDVPVLRMGNLQNGKIDWGDLVYTNIPEDIEKFLLIDGDLLFNRTNSRELVGKTALYNSEQQSIYAGYLIRFHMAGNIVPKYANIVMNSLPHRKWCNEVKTDALGQSNINATKLSFFRFPLPPLAEQQVIVTKVEKLLTLCDQLETQITENQAHAKKLMQAVLKEAFTQ